MENLLKVSAVNFNKLQHHYRIFQTNDEVILFEYLLMLSKHFKGKKFGSVTIYLVKFSVSVVGTSVN